MLIRLSILFFLNSSFGATAFAKDNSSHLPDLNWKKVQVSKTSTSDIKKFALSKVWLNFLYYYRDGDGFKSRVENSNFFINKKYGPTDPVKELEITLAVFQNENALGNTHPQCHFPGRYKLLSRSFDLRPAVNCPNYDKWTKAYSPNQLDLVFTSQYISNPASVFGHLFLLLPSKKQTESFWLTFNFAADMPSDIDPFSYSVGGITGWYTGDYSVMPYYHRLYQYGSIENRDLWNYNLRTTADELDTFLRHMWELIHRADFTYYFMDENCAGVLLRTFAAVFPEMQEAAELPFYIHPIEVIQVLKKFDRIKKIEHIPSQYNKVNQAHEDLNESQKQQFDAVRKKPLKKFHLTHVKVADTLVEYISYLRLLFSGELPPKYKKLEREIFVQRSQLPMMSSRSKEPPSLEHAPHQAHRTAMIGAGASIIDENSTLDLNYRFTAHGLLDPEPGFIKNSSVEVFHAQLSYHKNKLWLRELRWLNIENYLPAFGFDFKSSWKVQLAFVENLLTPGLTDQYFQSKFSYGASYFFSKGLIYSLLSTDINIGKDLPQGHIELGPELGMIAGAGPFKGYLAIHFGEALLQSSDRTFLKLTTGLRYSIHHNLSLIQKTSWSRLLDQNLEGHRFSLSLRHTF